VIVIDNEVMKSKQSEVRIVAYVGRGDIGDLMTSRYLRRSSVGISQSRSILENMLQVLKHAVHLHIRN
jgi:hypothetical protein